MARDVVNFLYWAANPEEEERKQLGVRVIIYLAFLGCITYLLMIHSGAPGNFALEVRNAQGLVLNRVQYAVAGAANLSRSMDRNAELQIKLNKKDYQPGEDIELSIQAPYTGAGLITIERDKVYTHTWFKADKTASVQKIILPKDFEGNGYVSVHFIRDPASDEIYTSPLSYGVVPFATSLAKRTANISLSSTELIKPGETMKITLKSDKPTKAFVFAVDEGILQVARYNNPDPLKHFFDKRALEVTTLQTLDLILPEFKKLMQGAAPGGDAEGALGKHLNPFKRKRDKPVAYWSGLVDVQGSREFSYTVPESFNGALRVIALAVNDETTAVAATKTTVRGDLILLPNLPLAISPGDVVEVAESSKAQLRIKSAAEAAESRGRAEWIEVDTKALKGTFKARPQRTELPSSINESLVVELYSK